MAKLEQQRDYLLENGMAEEKVDRFIELKKVTNEELDKCIETLKALKNLLAEDKYSKMEAAFNQYYKAFDGAKYDLAYEKLENKISMYMSYMNNFRIGIRKVFNKDIF